MSICRKIINSFLYLNIIIGLSFVSVSAQSNQKFNSDTVKAQRFDTGKMWTFEDMPVDYFESAYNFKPTEEWQNKVRMSSLRFASWCSASFVSGDGLVMTNHHCVDFISESIQKEGENVPKNGFYAPTLADERRVPNLFVDQLVLIEDVTKKVISAVDRVESEMDKINARRDIIKELQQKYNEETGLDCQIIELYNGGKYSIYGYRRYTDVRMVFVVEREMGLWGGDPDNFTYPRYNADFSFLRVYDDNGKPLKTDNYFKWSPNGASENEPLFVPGNPGSTRRLKTVSQIEYYRDVTYRDNAFMLEGMYSVLNQLANEIPEKADEYNGQGFFVANSAKVYTNALKGLRDPYLIARKKAFENNFKTAVMAKPELKEKYGHIWDEIAKIREELKESAYQRSAYLLTRSRNTSFYFEIAAGLVQYAEALKELETTGSESEIEKLKNNTKLQHKFGEDIDYIFEERMLGVYADYLIMNLGKDHELIEKMMGGKTGLEAAKHMLKFSDIKNQESLDELYEKEADYILNSDDPFILFAKAALEELPKTDKLVSELQQTEKLLENELGKALFAVYGTSIPPDATFSLRISDGVMQSYEYNGTIAPTFTTFYGLFDRYYSHKKQYPWSLPERWTKPSSEFDLSTPYNFISTNDIIGGNSGSPIINSKAEVVGIVFDGNIESIPGDFLYTTEANRTISVASQGILEIIQDLFKYKRLAEELKSGQLSK